jgi:hypothetical protein
MPRAMELDDVTKVFYKHTNPSSRLKKIRISQLVEELQESWRLPFLECEQQNARTSNRFSKLTMCIPIHTIY